MPCQAITRGGTTCTMKRTETIVLDGTTMEICSTHQTTLEEYLDTFGMDTAIQRILHGRESLSIPSWTVTTATIRTRGSLLAGAR